MIKDKEEKPLNVWFELFLKKLSDFGLEYSSVDPVDVLEL